ncbi:LysR family transcriptional regulator [Thalassospira profundimaris]|uniref:LysR family transcriptional regulator n=1 Tax=Thalassospira profundimaris TaxID=502049 RepID=A0A367XIC2_9PROT|nr:LysR family transcriptional regulator [Thalassospira profundimaris]RCK52452.1 LysR family transcriptional regulator [Thalassospira profundimaris]
MEDISKRRFDWNLLHTFTVIVEERSITGAANRLLLRQPSVSNALKRLEDQIGARLIDRERGRFEVTEQGLALYHECREICGAIGRLSDVMQDSGSQLTGHLHLWMASHVVFPPLDDALFEFNRQHPHVTYEINVATSSHVVSQVLSQQASFGICLVNEQHPRLDYRRLYREHFGFFCGPTHHLFGRQDVTLADLRHEAFVSFSTDQLSDALAPVAVLRAREGMKGKVIATSPHLEEVRRLINAGLGIGPLPIHVVKSALDRGVLWQLPPYEAPPAIDIYLVTNPRMSLGRAERFFIDNLTSRLAAAPDGYFIYS